MPAAQKCQKTRLTSEQEDTGEPYNLHNLQTRGPDPTLRCVTLGKKLAPIVVSGADGHFVDLNFVIQSHIPTMEVLAIDGKVLVQVSRMTRFHARPVFLAPHNLLTSVSVGQADKFVGHLHK